MAISNRVKRNISFTLFIMGCVVSAVRIIEPIFSGHIDGWGWFDIFAAIVVTCMAYKMYQKYRNRVKKGMLFG